MRAVLRVASPTVETAAATLYESLVSFRAAARSAAGLSGWLGGVGTMAAEMVPTFPVDVFSTVGVSDLVEQMSALSSPATLVSLGRYAGVAAAAFASAAAD